MGLGQIIRDRREELGLTLDEVSNRIGFSKPYLSTIETNKVKNPPSDQLLKKLERILKFDQGVLIRIAHLESLPSDVRREYEAAEAENQKYRQMLNKLLKRKSNRDSVKQYLGRRKSIPQEPLTSFSAGHLVPIINRVAAGYPIDFDDMDYPVGVADDYVRCPDLHDPNAFAVRVVGDSMEPRFTEGDIVVFSPAAEVKNGDDCFVRFSMPHETTFKRVFFEKRKKQVRLEPRNKKHSPLTVEDDRISGVYRAVLKYEKL